MKNLNERKVRIIFLAIMLVLCTAVPCFADVDGLDEVVDPVIDLLNSFLKPLIAVVGAIGSLYCVLLGVKYARAEEPQDREKAKQHLKGAIIGFVLIFVLMVVLNALLPVLEEWASDNMI